MAGPAAETVPATRFYGRAGVRHAVHALIALASLEVAATLLLLPWAWGDYYRAHGEVAAFMTTKFVAHAAAAGLLLWAGRGDWRTWLLGVYSLLKATQAPLHMLPAFVLEVPPPAAYAAYLQHLPVDSRSGFARFSFPRRRTSSTRRTRRSSMRITTVCAHGASEASQAHALRGLSTDGHAGRPRPGPGIGHC